MTERLPADPGVPGEAHEMARSYSVGELLTMRDTLPLLICNISKLNPKIDSDIIKVPEDAHLDLKRNSRLSINLSSTTRKSTSRSSDTSDLSRNLEKPRSEVLDGPWSLEDNEDVILFRGNLTLQSREQKQMWMMRKRGSSDRSSQPFPAPSGFQAQKADNFRKFYAAVISPTHLRVTAGGRIVPNTRGLPHPTYTWNAKKHFFESTYHGSDTEVERQKPWLPVTNIIAGDSNSPLGTVGPTVENFFGPPLHSKSSTRSEAPTERNDVYSSGAAAPSAVEEIGAEEIIPPSENSTTVTQGQIKISPPSQFDVFRPFFINGQPFYPAPAGIQVPANLSMLPFNMLGNLNASYQPILPTYGMIQSPLQLPTGNFAYPQPMILESQQIGQQIPLIHTTGLAPSLTAQQLHAPVGQPFGMVPMMPITSLPDESVATNPHVVTMVSQIQALQQQLRHLENQLQNNKHQIDEQHVIHQHSHVQTQIRALQSGLNAQIFQSGLLPPEQYGPSMWNGGFGEMGVPLSPITNSGVVSSKADVLDTSPIYSNGFQTSVLDKTVLENREAAIGTPNPVNGDSKGSQSSMQPVQTSRKRLSAAAAMAPEFQPRSQLMISSQPGDLKPEFQATSTGNDPTVLKHSELWKNAENPLLSNTINWSTPGQWSHSNIVRGSAAMNNGHTMHSLTKGNPLTRSSTHFQTPAPLNTSAVTTREITMTTKLVDPYLMGYPPPGMPASTVRSADMVYSRELTREELQARQMYWGKVPRVLSKGLPKFDGKDFYAPSPEKVSISPKEHHLHRKSHSSQRSNTSSIIPNLISPKSARYKGTTPSRHESKEQQDPFGSTDSLEKPSQNARAGGTNTLPENDAASLAAWGMAKADEEEIFDRPAYLTSSFNARASKLDDTDSVKLKSSVSRPTSGRTAQPSFLQDMLRHTSRTATAAPTGALSSTIAHGYLPQYSGFAAASLAPSISNVGLPGFAHKSGRADRLGRHFPGRVENEPLPHNLAHQDLATAADHLTTVKGNKKEIVDQSFNANITEGFGPVYGGSDW